MISVTLRPDDPDGYKRFVADLLARDKNFAGCPLKVERTFPRSLDTPLACTPSDGSFSSEASP